MIAVGVIGAGHHGAALADHQAPLDGLRIAWWSASPGGADIGATRELATRIGAPFSRDWTAAVRDTEVPAVLVLGEGGAAAAAAEAALAEGKAVFCAAPAATRIEDVNRLAGAASGGRGVLLTGGTLRYSAAGRAALRLIGQGDLGRLHSVYGAVRLPAGGAGERPAVAQRPVLEDAGWDLLDFVVAAGGAEPSRVHTHADTLFGSVAPDTVVSIVRFENGLVATLEVARCLPPSIPAPPEGDVEVEVIGAAQAVRVVPGAAAVRVYGRGTPVRPWLDAPVLSMLADLTHAADRRTHPPSGVADVRRTVELMDAIRQAAGRPVRDGGSGPAM